MFSIISLSIVATSPSPKLYIIFKMAYVVISSAEGKKTTVVSPLQRGKSSQVTVSIIG
jgi:hypothetical protein